MTRDRGWRSPRIAAVGATRIAGRPTANPIRPASAAPPQLNAYTTSASQPAHSTMVASRKPTSTRPSAPFRRRFAKTSASRLGLKLASDVRRPAPLPARRSAECTRRPYAEGGDDLGCDLGRLDVDAVRRFDAVRPGSGPAIDSAVLIIASM